MRAGGLERPKALADQLLMPPTWFSPASGAGAGGPGAARRAHLREASERTGPAHAGAMNGPCHIEVTEMYMAFRDRAEDAAKVSDAFRVA